MESFENLSLLEEEDNGLNDDGKHDWGPKLRANLRCGGNLGDSKWLKEEGITSTEPAALDKVSKWCNCDNPSATRRSSIGQGQQRSLCRANLNMQNDALTVIALAMHVRDHVAQATPSPGIVEITQITWLKSTSTEPCDCIMERYFPNSCLRNGLVGHSYHFPTWLCLYDQGDSNSTYHFKFKNVWLAKPDLERMVKSDWVATSASMWLMRSPIVASPSFNGEG
ncbi:hypothetical protein VNO78_21867 [Psophocarpus tetragonolobus]|uniref:Uncharacterized protein n=1 Tax=Psophocarpus tetragonolobus TaxID=3891 RepID=A0AAN9SCP3_PSOTE